MKHPKILALFLALLSLSLPACNLHKEEESQSERHKVVVTSPKAMDVVLTQQYVCQIRSKRHIQVCALQGGYLEAIHIKEGQSVKTDDVMFKVIPILYQAKYDAEKAEVQYAELEYKFTKQLADDPVAKAVSPNEVLLFAKKLAKAQANLKKSEAELKFATVKAPWDGIVDRLYKMQGSLIKEGDELTTLSDNSVMWVYFNVPEVRYLEDEARRGQDPTRHIELVLADGNKFPQPCQSLTKEAQFNNETGNIQYRADFANPDRLLRHGQTGNILIHRTAKNAIVIPQRATFEILDKRYVYVVDKEDVVHQREIAIAHEKDDIFIIKKGLEVTDRIVLEGGRQVRHDEKLEEFETRTPEAALANQKNDAE